MAGSKGKHTGELVTSFEGGHIIECGPCGFKHVMPMPEPEQLRRFYEQEFYQSEKTDYLEESANDIEWKNVEFSRRFELAKKYLPENSERRVLDIGCGPGDFLALGKSLGWESLGIEPSFAAAKFAQDKGLNVLNSFFDAELIPTLGRFDFIHMSEVLEHIPNPAQILQWAWQLLEPGGLVCISVPNDFSRVQECVVNSGDIEPWWVVPDHHLNYFDFMSLERLLCGLGYEALKKTTNFPMELFLLMGQNYTTDDTLGRDLHGWRKNFDVSLRRRDPELLNNFYDSLASVGMGRLVVQFARKPLS